MELPIIKPHSGHLQTHYKITTENLSYKLTPTNKLPCTNSISCCTTKYLLKNVTCEAKPGELTAIAGPSGAGKTTLMEILAGIIIRSRISGKVLINDQPMNVSHHRRASGYVTQDEALFPLLTVEETVTYSARLRLKADREKAKCIVKKLLKELGLEHIAGVRVGNESTRGISGGEKRRLSIGVELVHDPAVLLIDEPTSGLDSASALQVMLLLKSMAQNQYKTIVVTIHQPGFRILDLIDKVVLLSGGMAIHSGSLSLLEERLKFAGHAIPAHVNVLEFAIDATESLQRDDKKYEIDEQSDRTLNQEEEEGENPNSYSNNYFIEVLILAQRFSRNIFRSRGLFAAKAIQALLVGIVLGTVFINTYSNPKKQKVQNQVGFFAFTLTFLISVTTEALPIFLEEKRILMRETSRGAYRISSYIIANTLVFFPFLLLFSLLFTTPVYWLVGLRRDILGFLYFTLVVWVVVLMANSFVACFSAIVPDFITGMSVIYGATGSFFLFSGYFLSNDSIPKYWSFIHYLSFFKYPYECFLINEYGGEEGKMKCLENIGGECFVYGSEFLVHQGLKESQKWSNLLVMVSFVIGYRFVGFLFLSCRYYGTRS